MATTMPYLQRTFSVNQVRQYAFRRKRGRRPPVDWCVRVDVPTWPAQRRAHPVGVQIVVAAAVTWHALEQVRNDPPRGGRSDRYPLVPNFSSTQTGCFSMVKKNVSYRTSYCAYITHTLSTNNVSAIRSNYNITIAEAKPRRNNHEKRCLQQHSSAPAQTISSLLSLHAERIPPCTATAPTR